MTNQVLSPEDRAKQVVVQICKHLHKSAVRNISIEEILNVYIFTDDYRYGHHKARIATIFKGLPAFIDLEGAEKLVEQIQNVPTCDIFDRLFNDNLEEKLYNLTRKQDLLDIQSEIADVFENEIDTNDVLEGFVFTNNRLTIPRDITVELSRLPLHLFHRSMWELSAKKRAEQMKATVVARNAKKLYDAKKKAAKLRLENIPESKMKRLLRRSEKTSFDLDKELITKNKMEDAMIIFKMRLEASNGSGRYVRRQ